uniref:RNA binding protein n=1 Tax=Grapevine virus F TaxID=1221437 RepID=A0A811ARN7_9VIRU|nr:RNA binding protein [Grapevine virus F]
MAKRRRRRRLGVCKCGALAHNSSVCNKQPISGTKLDRLEFVRLGRVTIEGETPVAQNTMSKVLGIYSEIAFNLSESARAVIERKNKNVRLSRMSGVRGSPEEYPEYYNFTDYMTHANK